MSNFHSIISEFLYIKKKLSKHAKTTLYIQHFYFKYLFVEFLLKFKLFKKVQLQVSSIKCEQHDILKQFIFLLCYSELQYVLSIANFV